MIKKIGTAAREELERFFDTKVFLDLHVRVKSEWREDEHVLPRTEHRPSGRTNVSDLHNRLRPASECRSTPPTR